LPAISSLTAFNQADRWHKDGYKYVQFDHGLMPGLKGFNTWWQSYAVQPADQKFILNREIGLPNLTTSLTQVNAATQATLPKYLCIAQGTGINQRIGREVKVVKDVFTFKISIPKTDIACTDRTAALTQRKFNCRAICLFVPKCRRIGHPGDDFQVADLFRDPFSVNSKFKKQGAFGYKILFDQTKTILPNCLVAEGLAPGSTGAMGSAPRTSYPGTWDIRFNVGSYVRRYAENDVLGAPVIANTTGDPAVPIPVESQTGLVSGEPIWYFFVQDTNPQIRVAAVGPPVVTSLFLAPQQSWLLYQKRDTVWTDA